MHAIKYNIKINFHLYNKNIGYTYLLLRCTVNVYVCIFWKKEKVLGEIFHSCLLSKLWKYEISSCSLSCVLYPLWKYHAHMMHDPSLFGMSSKLDATKCCTQLVYMPSCAYVEANDRHCMSLNYLLLNNTIQTTFKKAAKYVWFITSICVYVCLFASLALFVLLCTVYFQTLNL